MPRRDGVNLPELGIPWPRVEREPTDMTPLEMATGHPTAPGFREDKEPRHGLPSPGNGTPGVPRTRSGPRGQLGFPANSGGGFPVQPDPEYDNPFGDDVG